MMGFVQISFDELIGLLVRGNSDPSYVGVFIAVDGPQHWKVWRRGRLARIENPPGSLSLIAGEDAYWLKGPLGDVIERPRSDEYDDFELSALTMLEPDEYWREWLGQDLSLVESTLRPVEHEGRPAWEFTAPPVKGGAPVLTVDAELGILLQARRDDVGVLASWSEVRTDVPLTDELFAYDGTWR
jgi:hypothetical protein